MLNKMLEENHCRYCLAWCLNPKNILQNLQSNQINSSPQKFQQYQVITQRNIDTNKPEIIEPHRQKLTATNSNETNSDSENIHR